MSSSRPLPVTPTTSSFPAPDAPFSSTPSQSGSFFAGGGSYTSPSPRTRLGNRDLGDFDEIDSSPPAAFAAGVESRSSFAPFPQNLPRTSSRSADDNPPRTSSLHPLLPPARVVVDSTSTHDPPALRDPFSNPRPAPKIPDSTREHEPHHKRGHSRSSSAGGLSDTLRNLNRWSASTTSSRASNIAGFTRRVSAEFLGAAFTSPGRKLHRGRLSTSGGSPRPVAHTTAQDESPRPPTASIPPLRSLPRISTGPSLEDEVFESDVLGHFSPIEAPGHAQQPGQDTGARWDVELRGWEKKPGSTTQPHNSGEPPPPTDMITPEPTMSYTQNGHASSHSRGRSTGTKASGDTTASLRSRERDRSNKTPSQKAMLSKALQKANTAVQLDNAQNFEGARRAYAEACAVLQQVLLRTSGEEDRRKLEAIHETYIARVMELDEQLIDIEPEGKALPQRPESNDLQDLLNAQAQDYGYSNSFRAGAESHDDDDEPAMQTHYAGQELNGAQPSVTRVPVSHIAESSRDARDSPASYLTSQYSLQSAFSKARYNNGSALRPTMDSAYMPQPLSPRRPSSPARPPPRPVEQVAPERTTTKTKSAAEGSAPGHQRTASHESVSWLDPIDESERSSASSLHSRSSSVVKSEPVRIGTGATVPAFGADLDDAIEAAYEEEYAPQYPELTHQNHQPSDPIAATMRRVELAREMVRESEREALEVANERERRLREQQEKEDREFRRHEGTPEEFYDGNDSEEEERLLEAMTSGNIEDFAFGGPSGQPVPRESDSSGMTNRTWHSSIGSNPPSGTTALTPVSEHSIAPRSHPAGPLPALPTHKPATELPPQPPSAGSQGSGQSVRSRRLSGQNAKELTIETAKPEPKGQAPPATASAALPPQPKPANFIVQQRQALSAGAGRTVGPFSRTAPSPAPVAPTDDADETDPLPPIPNEEHSRVGTPSIVRPGLRKNFSSSSLRSIKTRNLSISHMDETSEYSPSTPHYGHFGSSSRLPAVPSLPAHHAITTSTMAKDRANSTGAGAFTGTGGLHLFDNHIHSPDRPGSPNPALPDAPAALEPCPTDVMLRPFWLMRCLYQTLCHPRGGYLSNKLFVPREVWRVKGVKLKNVEDKIANCDLLTAALQKLATVDTCDADAVLEEMQALESVLESVQAALSRKLGSEVGVQGTSAMFKEAANAAMAGAGDGVDGNGQGGAGGGGVGSGSGGVGGVGVPRSASVAGKSSSFSWRRLRSKNSSANLPGLGGTSYGGGKGGYGASSVNLGDGKDGSNLLASLPMTTHPTSRPTKRDVASAVFTGPNANYMASLARLFDAAQTIDQIARQVDDPGLRHADKTQVGLELCTRHAAEFFAFYICRFALSDLSMLLDKFIKRGSEWVLA
ncbi:hypothetical protein VTK26DRAFT_238 [Humicola hyalothermophila]